MTRPIIKLIRRTPIRFSLIVAPADAVNETMRVSRMGTELMSARKDAVRELMLMKKQQALALKINRKLYRARKQAQALASGQFDPTILMTDALIDKEIERERQLEEWYANQPQFRQGDDGPRVDTERLADQYATVSNFYTSLGSPNIMPMNTAQVYANPTIAAQQLDFGLNNPALTTLLIATPMGEGTGAFGAAKTAFLGSMRTAAPLFTKVVLGTGQAIKAGGKAVAKNAPKVVGNTVVMSVPATAAAADFGNEDPNALGGEQGGSAMPWIIGAGAAIGGAALWNKFRKGTTTPKWFTWWERNPNAVAADARFNTLSGRYNTAFKAGDQAAMDALKTELGKSPKQTITQGTGKRAKTVDNPDFISNTDLGTMIQNRAYPQTEGFIIEPKGARFWRGVRNWGLRLPIYSTVAGNIGHGIYNWMSPEPSNDLPTAEQYAPTYQETDSAVLETVPGDTVVVIPREAQPDTTKVTPVLGGIVWSTQQ